MRTKEYNNIIELLGKQVYQFIFKSVQNEELTNDLCQDVFMKLWENRNKIEINKVKSWMFSTAHNTMINRIKKESRTENSDFEQHKHPTYDWDHALEQREIIDICLEQLPQLQKSIILLRDLEGYNYKEIGKLLNISESQVKVYLFRARKKMKDLMKDLNKILER